ncbi:MAG: precorrin-4 C(11)-methyltransferase [Deltaproteobacteria bacterium]|jgi:precorrin-4/cobalt-precorrin-4 C11-methyltransferase|nr:precorrin-4 C(11)-methyltransferase [Deltaproteobacteria bacterium]
MTSKNKKSEILFVGAGPGDPELITVAGQKALREADLIVVAGSLVNLELLLVKKKECQVVDSAPLDLPQIVDTLISGYDQGLRVVRLHTGDPSLYGAVHEQFSLLKKAKVPYRIIPGVTAAMAAAAELGLEFTIPEITQSLIVTRIAGRTPMPIGEDLLSLTKHQTSLALYLSAAQGQEVGKTLTQSFGENSPVAVCYRVSWPDAQIFWTTPAKLAQTLAEHGLDRHALILAGPALAALKSGKETPKSKLYDPQFGHAHRKAKKVPEIKKNKVKPD